MKKIFQLSFVLLAFSILIFPQEEEKDSLNSGMFSGLKWRNIGPAFCSGRIADFAVNPQNFSEYYVAVASGHVWKTTNSGTTFKPIFDNHNAYSMGCVTIDPNNPFTVWIGTGENNHQRALGYGNGVYKSTDGGNSWKNMGLKDSRQVGDIIIDPRDSDIIFVAAEGSAWGPGGDRGLYKSVDGGENWKKVLEISENTGVNNVLFDPRDPDVMYATSEQRRRHVYSKIGGGPESAVYKSADGGETWNKIMKGLPKVDIGGMGIDISPANPDVIYLIVEAAEDKGGFFRSTNRGASWQKMNDYNASGQYFNEIYCDPKDVDKVYAMDVVSRYTEDGGKTFKRLGLSGRHVDDHAMWINPNDTQHFLIGGDGGVYETFDGGDNYDFKENLPVTQFYRVNVDNSEPFYFVYGGTQDNNSMGGPSQTLSSDGIVNSDWFVTNGGDGFWSAIDPENPDIVYAESQYGGMVRYDRKSDEAIDIRPEPRKGELTYKWNWDTPLIISPHKNTRIYCAANKVFRSEDRGDSWEVISDDLTAQIDRNSFKVMDKYWSIDAVAKDKSTSLFGTIVSLTESPIKEDLLYVGTDDGVIQVSEDAKTWTKINEFPGVPEYTFVVDICPSNFDENVVYAAFNNHKRDDFKPYLLKSNDKGKSWTPITNGLPENGPVHSIAQDNIDPDLLFVGTEFSFYFSNNGGEKWIELNSGLPSVAVEDIALQSREDDLVIATFGRGFYIIDDYSALRFADQSLMNKEAHIFPIKDALMYVEGRGRYGQGATYFKAPNPEYGATISYYIKDVPQTLKSIRHKKEKELFKESKPIPQPSDEELQAEKNELNPYLIFTIMDEDGNVVRKINKSASKGINRVVWDLRYSSTSPIREVEKFKPTDEWYGSTFAMPGKYKVALAMVNRDGIKQLVEPVEFNVNALRNTTLPAADRKELVEFQKKSNELARTVRGTERFLDELQTRISTIKKAISVTPEVPHENLLKAIDLSKELNDIALKFNRDSNSPSAEENPPSPVTINERLSTLAYTHWRSTSGITQKEIDAYNILKEEFPPVLNRLKSIYEIDIKNLEAELEKYGAPYTPGRIPEMK